MIYRAHFNIGKQKASSFPLKWSNTWLIYFFPPSFSAQNRLNWICAIKSKRNLDFHLGLSTTAYRSYAEEYIFYIPYLQQKPSLAFSKPKHICQKIRCRMETLQSTCKSVHV